MTRTDLDRVECLYAQAATSHDLEDRAVAVQLLATSVPQLVREVREGRQTIAGLLFNLRSVAGLLKAEASRAELAGRRAPELAGAAEDIERILAQYEPEPTANVVEFPVDGRR